MPKARAGVTRKKNESIDSLLSRFNSQVYKSGALIKYMDNMYFTSNSEKRREQEKKKKFEAYLENKREN